MNKLSVLIANLLLISMCTPIHASTINHISQNATWGAVLCAKTNITDFLNQKCLGKETCVVEASNEFFAPVTGKKDICPYHLKWMAFAYTCYNQDFPFVVIRSEGAHYQLNCAT